MRINKKAFTLIELLISISIIVVFFAFITFSPRGFYVQSITDQDALIIKNDIIKAYNDTVSGFTYGGYGYNNGFGLYFDINVPKKYKYFIDKNNDLTYTNGESISEIELKNAKLYNLDGKSTLSILFKQRDGSLYVNKVTDLNNDIIIKLNNNNVIRQLEINPKTYKINVK